MEIQYSYSVVPHDERPEEGAQDPGTRVAGVKICLAQVLGTNLKTWARASSGLSG